jgi:uncharacterized coiled-coil protein SlyX
MANYKLVDVKSIQTSEPRSAFKEAEIEEIANLFLTSGLIVEPLILKETVPHTFTVLQGHKLYYGAVKAREKDPRKAEMVNAFVVDRKDSSEVEEAILKQIPATPNPPIISAERTAEAPSHTRIENLETRINEQQQVHRQLEQTIHQKLKELESQIPKQRSFLEELNSLDTPKLVLRLKGLGVASADKVCELILAEREQEMFSSYIDVVDRVRDSKGKRKIGDRKMLEILQIASQTILLG